MAISFLGSVGGNIGNGADITLDLSTLGLQEGDLVVVAYGIGDNDNVDFDMAMVTAGYTEVADLHAEDTQDTDLGVFWKIMGATPDTSAVVDGQGGTDAGVAAVAMAFRGVDPTTPMDVTPTTATGINTMHPDPPSIDHGNPAGVWTVIAGASGHTLSAVPTYTFPAGYTTNPVTAKNGNEASDIHVALAYNESPSDPENPGVMTLSGTDSTNFSWAAATLALRPIAASNDRRAIVTWAEFETPNEPRRAVVTWAELETPNAPRRAVVTWAELETPDAPRRAVVTWAEFEVPELSGDRRAIVTWAELEVPNEPRRGVVTWAELETPNAPRRGVVTWAEFEVPDDPARRGIVTWAEFETPDAPRRAVITWAELSVPEFGEVVEPAVGGRTRRKVPRREHITLPKRKKRPKPQTFERRYRAAPLVLPPQTPAPPEITAQDIASIIAAIEAAEGDD